MQRGLVPWQRSLGLAFAIVAMLIRQLCAQQPAIISQAQVIRAQAIAARNAYLPLAAAFALPLDSAVDATPTTVEVKARSEARVPVYWVSPVALSNYSGNATTLLEQTHRYAIPLTVADTSVGLAIVRGSGVIWEPVEVSTSRAGAELLELRATAKDVERFAESHAVIDFPGMGYRLVGTRGRDRWSVQLVDGLPHGKLQKRGSMDFDDVLSELMPLAKQLTQENSPK